MLDMSARFLDRVLRVLDVGSLYLARLSGVVVAIIVLIISTEILSRSFLGRSMGFSTEISGYALAICVTWPLAHVLHRRGHIRIDVVHNALPSTMRAVLDAIALAAFGFVCYFLTGASVEAARTSFTYGDIANTPLGTPLWLPKALWALGFVWFSLNVFVMLLRIVTALAQRNYTDIQDLAGSGNDAVG